MTLANLPRRKANPKWTDIFHYDSFWLNNNIITYFVRIGFGSAERGCSLSRTTYERPWCIHTSKPSKSYLTGHCYGYKNAVRPLLLQQWHLTIVVSVLLDLPMICCVVGTSRRRGRTLRTPNTENDCLAIDAPLPWRRCEKRVHDPQGALKTSAAPHPRYYPSRRHQLGFYLGKLSSIGDRCLP